MTCPSAANPTTHTLSGTADGFAIDQNGLLWGGNLNESPFATPGCGPSSTYNTARTLYQIDTGSISGNTPTFNNGYWEAGGPGLVVIDANDNVWWSTNNSYSQGITSAGVYSIGPGAYGTGPYAGTTDMLGNVWFGAASGCTTASSTSTFSKGELFQVQTATALAAPTATIDAPTYVFYTSGASSCTTHSFETQETTTAALDGLQTLAADANNGLWVSNATAETISYLAPQSAAWTAAMTAPVSAIPSAGMQTLAITSMNSPWGLAVDGSNHAYVGAVAATTSGTNYYGSSDVLQEYGVTLSSTAGSVGNISAITLLNTNTNSSPTAYGFSFPNTSTPYPHAISGVAIDPSGNIWMTSNYATTPITYMSVLVGAATPVVTPLAFQAKYNLIGQPPQ